MKWRGQSESKCSACLISVHICIVIIFLLSSWLVYYIFTVALCCLYHFSLQCCLCHSNETAKIRQSYTFPNKNVQSIHCFGPHINFWQLQQSLNDERIWQFWTYFRMTFNSKNRRTNRFSTLSQFRLAIVPTNWTQTDIAFRTWCSLWALGARPHSIRWCKFEWKAISYKFSNSSERWLGTNCPVVHSSFASFPSTLNIVVYSCALRSPSGQINYNQLYDISYDPLIYFREILRHCSV